MNSLIAALNGVPVGQLQLEPSGAMAFQYRADWLSRPGARPISLSLPLSAQRYHGALVYNFFDNLLPDSDAIRGRMQARFGIPTSHILKLPIGFIGHSNIDLRESAENEWRTRHTRRYAIATGLPAGKTGQRQLFQGPDTLLAHGRH